MEGGTHVELVLLRGGRAEDASPAGASSRADLRVVRYDASSELQAAIEETVAAARTVRRDIEERIARALEDLAPPRAPKPEPG